MTRGTVKWFDNGKGYGYIAPENGSDDVFVHYSAIEEANGFRTLAADDVVDMEIKEGPKGPHAIKVVKV